MCDLNTVFDSFSVCGKLKEIKLNKTGHINKTFICTAEDSNGKDCYYTLQCVNRTIFKNVVDVMENIVAVTQCIDSNSNDPMCLKVIMAKDGKPYHIDSDGEFWRMFSFITDVVCKDVVSSETEAFLLGQSVATFQKKLSGLCASSMKVIIPDFHNIEFRYKQFDQAIEDAKANRAERLLIAKDEIEFFKERRQSSIAFFHDVCEKTPVRVTHNDAKLNNILFSKDFTRSCLIDLDTVMPGSALFDTGDMIRTVANTACEDEKDISKVSFNREYYNALKDGYFSIGESFLTELEQNNFFNSGKYITLVMGLRFLNDYFAGDTYYHIEYEDHNLVRCRTQVAMVKCMEEEKEYGIIKKTDWTKVPVLNVSNQNWVEAPGIEMKMQLMWDEHKLYVHQMAKEHNIRAINTQHSSLVCQDSCMEFFIAPGRCDKRYFNFEINPNGAMMVGLGTGREDRTVLELNNWTELFQIQTKTEQNSWEVFYSIPASFISQYFEGFAFKEGLTVRANCYKCGDNTDHIHYLSWNKMTSDHPEFHKFTDFGSMRFI